MKFQTHTGKEDVDFILNYCPPRIFCIRDNDPPVPDRPLSFYDRHLDEKLLLRRVLPFSSLLQAFADVADGERNVLMESGLPIIDEEDANGIRFRWARENAGNRDGAPATALLGVEGSYGFSSHFKKAAMDLFRQTASLLLMRPLKFNPVLFWDNRERPEHRNPLRHGVPFRVDGYALTLRHWHKKLQIPEDMFREFDAETQEQLQGVLQHCSVLGTWQIYPASIEGDHVLEDMEEVLSSGSFTAGICTTAGFQPSPSRCAPSNDANNVPWTPPPLEKLEDFDVPASLPSLRGQPVSLRRSARLKDLPGVGVSSKTSKSKRTRHAPADEPKITPAVPFLRAPKRPLEDFIQHGWNEAVIEDSTFIVFTNGVFERIGIRHRESQTLLLSDLVRVSRNDPPYGRIHVGLCIAAYRDAVDRYLQIRDASKTPVAESSHRVTRGNTAKRGSPEVDENLHPSTRRKTKEIPPGSLESVFAAASSRNLLLVRLVYGIYNSVTPASFQRSGPSLFPKVSPQPPRRIKAAYTSAEYVIVTLGPPLSSGATGVVHGALLEVRTKDGQLLAQNVIVKVALFPDQQERMRHEFSIYQRLAAAKVSGVPALLGIFDDVEGSASIMVMNNCGQALHKTHLKEDGINVSVSEAEKAAFLTIIEAIHKAGVRHRDMRAPNLLLNAAGEASIIDFDQAEFDPPEIGQKREHYRLKQLLEGNFTDADSVRTP
ncbi:hypothetical protein C8R46DRAFT_1005102 [Mycena filopes]|nr:hypothetical protein C8R46DRAFT_1005102 [Mycena filopes]